MIRTVLAGFGSGISLVISCVVVYHVFTMNVIGMLVTFICETVLLLATLVYIGED